MTGHNKSSQITEQIIPFDIVPTELTVKILTYLPKENWLAAALICKQWHVLMIGIRERTLYEEQRAKQLEALGDSELWRYLQTMIDGGDITTYLIHLLSPMQIHFAQPSSIHNLKSFFTFVWSLIDTATFEKQYTQFSCHLEKTETFLIEQAQQIIASLKIHNPNKDKPYTSLSHCLSLPIEKSTEQATLFLAYKKMEDTLLMMSMFAQLWTENRKPKPVRNFYKIIYDPKVNRWLQEHDLVLLNQIHFPELIETMIKDSLTWHRLKESEKKTLPESQQTRYRNIDQLLSRMQAKDWLAFLSPQDNDENRLYFTKQARATALLNAMKVNHPIILAKCTEDISLRILTITNINETIIAIMQSSLTLKHLSNKCIIELAAQITHEEFDETLTVNPDFLKRFDFALAENLIEKNPHSGKPKWLLMRTPFLNKLDILEMAEIAQPLTSNDFADWLNSPAFLTKLNSLANDYEKSQCLLLLAKKFVDGFPLEIAKNSAMANLLTETDIKELITLDARTKPYLRGRLKTLHAALEVEKCKPILTTPVVQPPTNYWKKGLIIVGLILLAAVSIGLIITGAGVIVGVPLLFQILLLTIGALGVLGTAGLSMYKIFSQSDSTDNFSNDTHSTFKDSNKNILSVLRQNNANTVTNVLHLSRVETNTTSLDTQPALLTAQSAPEQPPLLTPAIEPVTAALRR